MLNTWRGQLPVIVMVVILAMMPPVVMAADEVIPPEIARLLEQRNKAMAAKDFDRAYRILQQILEIDPRNYRALYNMAIIHFMKKEYDQGLPLLARALTIAPSNISIRAAYARALRESGNDEQAIAQYQILIKDSPPSSKVHQEAQRHLALLQLKQAAQIGDIPAIDKIGAALLANYPRDPSVYYRVGATAAEAERYALAEQAFSGLIKLAPNSAAAHFYLANVYESTGRNALAEQEFKLALDLKPKPGMAKAAEIKYRTLLGLRLLNNDEVLLARREFENVVELDPDHIVANMNLGLIYIDDDDLERAAKAFEHVIKAAPDELEARIRLATVYLDIARVVDGVRQLDYVVAHDPLGSFGERAKVLLAALEQRIGPRKLAAMRQYIKESDEIESALAQSPEDAAALYKKAGLLMQQQKADEAISVLEKLLALDPGHVDARIQLGALLEEKGRYQEAAENYAVALSLLTDPERIAGITQRLLTVQAQLYLSEKNYSAAEEAFHGILSISEDSLSSLWGLARLKTVEGHLEEAVGWYDKLLKHQPENIGARINIAQLYERLGEEEKALTYYRGLVLDMNANETTKKMAEKRVDVLQRKINGFAYVLSYAIDFNDNSTLSPDNKVFDYSSNTSFRIDYNYKIRKGLKFSFAFSPAYQVYHIGQYDYLNLNFNPALTYERDKNSYTLGLQKNNQYGVLRSDGSVVRSNIFMFNASRRHNDTTFYQANLGFQTFASQSNPIFDANTYSGGLVVFKRRHDGSAYNYGYSLTWKKNNNDLGSDYAYVGQTVTAGGTKRFGSKLNAYASLGFGFDRYTNPDSITEYRIKRKNINLQAQLGASYRFDDRFTFTAGYAFYLQRSTLPVGLLTQVQVIEQASSLGSYSRNSINVGVRVSF